MNVFDVDGTHVVVVPHKVCVQETQPSHPFSYEARTERVGADFRREDVRQALIAYRQERRRAAAAFDNSRPCVRENAIWVHVHAASAGS